MFLVCAGAAGGCLRPGLCPLPTVRRGAGKQARMLLRIPVDAHACVSACLCVCLAAGVSAYFSACLPVSTFRANDVCAACRDVVRGCDGRGWRDHLLPRLLVPPDALPRQHHHRPHWAHGKQQAATHLIIALSLSKQIALPFSSCRAQRLRTGCAVCMVHGAGGYGGAAQGFETHATRGASVCVPVCMLSRGSDCVFITVHTITVMNRRTFSFSVL